MTPQLTSYRHDGYFQLCIGTLPPNFSYTSEFGQPGQFNHWLYLVSGSGTLANFEPLVAGSIYNLEQFYGQQVEFTTGAEGAEWVAVNPFHGPDRYDCELLDPAKGDMFTPATREHLVVFSGSVTVDGQTVAPKTAHLLEPGSSYLIRTDRAAAAIFRPRPV
jgi:hypothetical protein